MQTDYSKESTRIRVISPSMIRTLKFVDLRVFYFNMFNWWIINSHFISKFSKLDALENFKKITNWVLSSPVSLSLIDSLEKECPMDYQSLFAS